MNCAVLHLGLHGLGLGYLFFVLVLKAGVSFQMITPSQMSNVKLLEQEVVDLGLP